MTHKFSILVLTAMVALGTTALSSTDASARGGGFGGGFRGSFHAVHVSPASHRGNVAASSSWRAGTSASAHYQAINRMTSNKPAPTLTTVAGNTNRGSTSLGGNAPGVPQRWPNWKPKWKPNVATGSSVNTGPGNTSLGGNATGANHRPVWKPNTTNVTGYPPSGTRGGSANGPTTFTGPPVTNNSLPRWQPKLWQPGSHTIVDNGPPTTWRPWHLPPGGGSHSVLTGQPVGPFGYPRPWIYNASGSQLTANFTNSAGYPRPFSHPPHNLDGPHCSFVDAEALFETVRNDIDATIANTGQRDDAAQQLVVSILANLEPLQQAGVDSDWARQLTALAVSRAIEKMLATLAKDQYKRYHGEKPTKDQLAAAIDQLRGSGLAQAIADIKSMVGKNGCHPGNAAPGISPALVANIVDIEGTIQSDLDSTGYTDPNLKRDVRIWSGEAAIGLTSALINGTNECQAVDALVTQITNTFGDAEPALAGQVISDLSTLTGRDLSRCQ